MKNKLNIVIPTVNNLHKLEKIFFLFNQVLLKEYCRFDVVYQGSVQKIPKFLIKKNIFINRSITNNLSTAKNLGLRKNKSIKIFLDDDILVKDKLFLKKILDYKLKNNSCNIMFYKINIFNSDKPFSVHMNSFLKKINYNNLACCMGSAMVVYENKNRIYFDKNFGIGGKYGSAEESDFIINALLKKYIIYYNPKIKIEHPEPFHHETLNTIKQKFYKYGIGQGALLKKYLNKNFLLFYFLFLKICLKSFAMIIFSIILINKKKILKNYSMLSGKIYGFFNYKKI